MIKLFEIYSSDVPQIDDQKIYETFQKKWGLREIWINPTQLVSITDHGVPDEVIASLPKGLMTEAGFSNVTVAGGYHAASLVVVGNPRYVAEKILEAQK